MAAVTVPDAELNAEVPLLRARAAEMRGQLFFALAREGRARLARLPFPPARLRRFAALLPVEGRRPE